MKKRIVCLLVAATVASLVGAQSAPSLDATKTAGPLTGLNLPNPALKLQQIVHCPATINVQATNAPQPWYPSAIQMFVDSVTLSSQPIETQQMICRYKGSGAEWFIGTPIRPTYKSCVANGKSSFTCTK